jgi:hypothetical protein
MIAITGISNKGPDMPPRKNQKHRTKARREAALYNLKRALKGTNYSNPIGTRDEPRAERIEQEIAVLESRIESYT